MTRVVLRPAVRFSGEIVPEGGQVRELHDRAHHECYIANSVRTVVTVDPG
jgi:organic hydroperoxide reductase OsmC/OhrA